MAASGASAQMTALDATSNNLANARTVGFKADQAVFQEHLIQAMYAGSAQREMRYAGVAAVTSDHAAGPIQVTGQPLDVAVDGEGFFVVQGARGVSYTRAGAFHVTEAGQLVTADGQAVLDTAERPLAVAPGLGEARIDAQGALRVGDEVMGQLKLVRFDSPERLEREGNQRYLGTKQSGPPVAMVGSLLEGAVEMPNVSVVNGMTQLVSASRTFETLQRAVEVFSELEHRAANDIVSGV